MPYEEDVFINCPFDADYRRFFHALVFSVQDCGFRPRSALEIDDGSEVRIDKIMRIIGESRYGIHDLSRTEPDAGSGLPRFNMPLELGLFLGAKYFGGRSHRAKACVIFEREKFRYQQFCSDIAGMDVRAHRQDEAELVRGVRDALRTWRPHHALPSGSVIYERYLRFTDHIPRLVVKVGLRVEELTFNDLTQIVSEWLNENPVPASRAGPSSPRGALYK